ncbi:YbaB/EbfC family nucleoid-associated protein [Mycobacterium intracellulare]|uniref:YbaB/EbfC family nucleoid-associated protein n=1 Tax=Mycobacterium intracellulare TaxID=1767 RepID=A0AAE4UBW6_MYCIT|nr:YbaB/EbfC family nucleoid-associated protein [Mycobacterium intracellulare]MCA2319867.1 YbaB/EbfC family nucleoid-associated protein [Mycobacterium intracellulare]MCA2342839.1 YbaB/EbfC family nucleoid-associated protein [Mycobacterium intracellulare]MDV6979733.1 YbaB/EbfC family nucleoid-associated protein [Mycobacterium intracellulare]MDV6985375.1 YbaB/EbfC family nucleoid-associated protein [Mycobacterium intracellulare]MDV7015596.1 YbaB/EbfC family nucleoid-associated protein [Mycobacte
MRDPAHPAIARMVEQFQMVMSLLDQQVRRMQTASFVVSDETETIEVTMNGHLRLTGLVIDPGILSLGAQEVSRRINEALSAARDFVNEWVEEDVGDLEARVVDALMELRDLPPPT